MSNVFRVVYPLASFDGGLNNKYSPNIIEDNESPDLLNVVSDDLGSVGTRLGSSKINTTSVGSYACDGFAITKFNNGNTTLCAAFNGTLYEMSGTTFYTIPSAQSVFTPGNKIDTAMYQNVIFIGDGTNPPYKYNGTEFTRHGVDVPAAGKCTLVAGGVLTGCYRYKFTYVNSYLVEGDLSSFTTLITAASNNIDLYSLPIAPTSYGVNARRIYRTIASGVTYLLAHEISDNTSTTYSDSISDASLTVEGPEDNGLPPNWDKIVSFKERLFVVDPDEPQFIYYSDLGEPFTFESTNFLMINDGDGGKITGLGVHGDSVVIHKDDNSIWLIYMADTDPTNWTVVKTNSKYGSVNNASIVDYENMQMFAGLSNGILTGFYSFSGTSISPDVTELQVTNIYSESKSDRIIDTNYFNPTYINKIVGINYKNKLYYAVPYDSSTYNNRIYVYDYIRRNESSSTGAWFPWSGLNANCFCVFDGELIYGDSSGNGHIYKLEQELYADDGVAIDSYMYTKEYEGYKNHINLNKDYRFANFLIETLGDYDMDCTIFIDSDKGVGTTRTIDLNPGGSLWGTMVYGTGTWGGGLTRDLKKVQLGKLTGKRIQFKFTNQNTVNQAFKVINGDFIYNTRGYR